MKEEILSKAFNEDNWEPFKTCLVNNETTAEDLDSVFLETYIDLDSDFTDKINALMVASIKGNIEILELLFNYAINVNQGNFTALMYAAEFEKIEVARFLIKKGANVNFQNEDGDTTLKCAIYSENFDMVELLLKEEADPNLYNIANSNLSYHYVPPIVIAAKLGNVRIISLLLDPKFQTDQHQTQLDQISSDRLTALTSATTEEIVDIILSFPINVKNKAGGLALSTAAASGNLYLVTRLLDLGANPNYFDESKFTPLMQAIVGMRIDVPLEFNLVSSILASEKNQTTILPDTNNFSFPNLSAEQKEEMMRHHKPGPHRKVIKLLLERGAVPAHPKGISGNTAVKLAEIMEDAELINLFKNCHNEVAPKTDQGFFFIYDIFDKYGISTSEISTKTLNLVQEGEHILHRGDLIINGNIPKDVQIRVIDGDITIHGNVKENVKIFASQMPLVKLRNGHSVLISSYIIFNESGGITYGNPSLMMGTVEQHGNRILLNGEEFIIPCISDIPTIKGKITIDGNIDDSTEVIALGHVFVNEKRMVSPSPYYLDPDNGEVTEYTLEHLSAFDFPNSINSTSYENIYLFKKITDYLFTQHNTKLNEILCYSAGFGKLAYLRILIEKNINLNCKVRIGFSLQEVTPLQIAAHNNQLQSTLMLLQAGADPNFIPDKTSPALHLAIDGNYHEIAEALINAKANLNFEDYAGFTALKLAARQGNELIVKRLLKEKVNINFKSSYSSAFTLAVNGNHMTIIRDLVKAGAIMHFEGHRSTLSHDIKNDLKNIALEKRVLRLAARYYNCLKVLEQDFVNDLAIEPSNYNKGKTQDFLLGFNIWKRLPEVLQVEICRIAADTGRVPSEDARKKVPAFLGNSNPTLIFSKDSSFNYQNLEDRKVTGVELLIEVLKKCTTKKDGVCLPKPELALRRAAYMGRLDQVKILVNIVKDIDINESGDSGKTALDFAKEENHNEVVHFLENIGAKAGKKNANNL